MQQSGHIGKIVVTPPETKESAVAAETPIARADGSYLIVGGLGGFGLRTAQWLVDHGARNLMLVGRRGIADDATQAVLNTIEEGGVTVRTAAIDVSAAEKVTALFEDMAATMPPIRGILHTAMVLDDGLIMNMDGSRIDTVLRPKVQGAHNLDRASRGLELDFFVLFSSATTLVGNPGQSNYVAANAYLEGLARQRRAEGLPALAISWGAIGDAGYLARNSDTNEILSARLGRHTLKAKDALEGMSLLLRHGGNTVADAAVGYARIDWAAARKELAIVKSALYSVFLGDRDDDMGDGEGQVDLDALLKGMDRISAVETIAKLLSSEIAKILRMPADEIERHRPLTEVGMDSLMALELRMSAEKRLGIDIPLMSLANGATMNDIANRIVARHLDSSGQEEISADSELLADQHMTEDRATYIDAKEIAAKVESRSAEIRNLLK
jgi:NAD(P)-dependent dehydrogenase (short-subunit alcohol dehydrogenase family)/acyl carrier protein